MSDTYYTISPEKTTLPAIHSRIRVMQFLTIPIKEHNKTHPIHPIRNREEVLGIFNVLTLLCGRMTGRENDPYRSKRHD